MVMEENYDQSPRLLVVKHVGIGIWREHDSSLRSTCVCPFCGFCGAKKPYDTATSVSMTLPLGRAEEQSVKKMMI